MIKVTFQIIRAKWYKHAKLEKIFVLIKSFCWVHLKYLKFPIYTCCIFSVVWKDLKLRMARITARLRVSHSSSSRKINKFSLLLMRKLW